MFRTKLKLSFLGGGPEDSSHTMCVAWKDEFVELGFHSQSSIRSSSPLFFSRRMALALKTGWVRALVPWQQHEQGHSVDSTLHGAFRVDETLTDDMWFLCVVVSGFGGEV